VLVRHPADWYIPFIVGVRHYYLKTDTPIRWLARAIELNPAAASAHLYIGAVLLEADYFDQAMLELRIASRHNNSLVHKAVAMLEARESSFETLSKMAVTREDKKLIWNALALRFEAKGKKDEAEAADLALLELDPMHPGALMRHARRLSGRQENERALQLAHKLGSLPDLGPAGIQLESSILEKAKRHEEAIAVLERGLVRFPKNPALLNALAWSLQRAGKHDEAIKTARTIKGMMVQSRSRSQAVLLEYRLLMAEGKTSAALASLREAHSLDPGNTSILLRIANLAEQKGDKRRALDALRKLKLALPGDKEITERIEKIESIKYLQTE
jgi:tetratricopeptide (TPR) repeat protein